MADFYFSEFQNYLQTLCELHTDVAHNVNGQKSFARMFSNEEMDALANNAGQNIVVVSSFFGRAIGSLDEQLMQEYATIRFACNAAAIGAEGINVAMAKAWQIMWDFVTRLRKDARQDADDCGELENVDFAGISWDEIPDAPFLENHYGWELTLPFKSTQPQYNAAKWIS